MRLLITLAATAVAALPALTQAAEPPCLTTTEFTSLATYALPSLISGVGQRCATTLPTSAFLRHDGPQLASRYAAARPGAWPAAKAALIKLAPASKEDIAGAIRSMPDDALQQIADTMITSAISDKIPTDRCASIDRAVQLLAPLPPENTAGLIALAIGLEARSGHGKLGKLSVCSA
ncbi:MAG: hypothetical protein JF593_00665 [Novosphingobium sp.]|nr:hypothetical protein [Novosphingobium sp.]